jgi:uncharacterized protein (TIGR02598 family)
MPRNITVVLENGPIYKKKSPKFLLDKAMLCSYKVNTILLALFRHGASLTIKHYTPMTVNHQHSVVDMERHRPGQLPAFRPGRRAFSLIEICIALGIVAFAFVALLGLLPVGLGNFSQAMNTQTSTEIYQRLAAELQETEFDNLIKIANTQKASDNTYFYMKYRYFDAEGQEVKVANPASPTDSEKTRIVYTANTRGSFPGKADPKNHTNNYFTSLPSTTGTRFNPRDLIFFAIQIASSKGRELDSVLDTTHFIDATKASKAGIPFRTYSIHVARNGYDLTVTP